METPMRPATIRQVQQHRRAQQHILAASVGRIHVGDVVGRGRAARGIHCRISPRAAHRLLDQGGVEPAPSFDLLLLTL